VVVTDRREFGGQQFDHVCRIEPERNEDGELRQFLPQDRYAKRDTVPLNRYGTGPFGKFKIPRHLRASGVYCLTVDGNLKYVGEAADLAARYNAGYGNISPKNCYKGGQETNCRLNSLIFEAVRDAREVDLWFHPTTSYKALELEMRAAMAPAWNRI
jgi:hypothetical protein